MTKNHPSERRRRDIVTVTVIVRITVVTTMAGEATKERSIAKRVANMTAKSIQGDMILIGVVMIVTMIKRKNHPSTKNGKRRKGREHQMMGAVAAIATG